MLRVCVVFLSRVAVFSISLVASGCRVTRLRGGFLPLPPLPILGMTEVRFPSLMLPTPSGLAFIRLPENVRAALLCRGIAPIPFGGELLVDLCYETAPLDEVTGDEFQRLVQSDDGR